MCLYETLHKDYLLPSSYTQKIACEIDNPQRPGAQHLAQPSVISSMTKESRKGQIHSMDTSCLNQVAVPWQQSKHCKSTILQGSISKMLKKRKEKRCLLRDAIPSLEAEQPSVPLLEWGGVHTSWHGALRLTLFKDLLSAVFWLGPEA